jgi:hypothetical protein
MKRGRCGNLASISSPSQTRRSGGDGARQHIISGRSGVGARQGSHNRQAGRGVSMNEQELRELIAAVKAGRVSRRAFARTMGGLGLTAPFVSQLVAHAGLAQSAAPIEYKPTRAGGGALRTLFWQAPTLLNPPFRGGGQRRRRGGDFLRAAGGLGSQRERRPGARRPDPGYRERRGRCRRHVRDLGAENRPCNGTTASPSAPTMSCSIGNTPPTRRRPPRRSAATRIWRSKRSIHLRCGFTSRNRRRSGQVAPTV